MIGHVAAAIGVVEFDARAGQKLGVGQNIFLVRVAAHGDDGRMFDDQELIGNLAALAALHQRALQLEGLGVAHAAQIAQLETLAAGRWPLASATSGING